MYGYVSPRYSAATDLAVAAALSPRVYPYASTYVPSTYYTSAYASPYYYDALVGSPLRYYY